jgi:xanthine dehydrogenase accessory factor
LRLVRCGFQVLVLEIEKPLAVRRLVSFAQAVFAVDVQIEGLRGRRVKDEHEAQAISAVGEVPVLVDPQAEARKHFRPVAMIDARMRKQPPDLGIDAAPWVIGLGPGFEAGINCHAIVETQRGHHMGRVIWDGRAQEDSGIPEPVQGFEQERVLRAPVSGVIEDGAALGSMVAQGDRLATIGGQPLNAPFAGALRGLLHDGLEVRVGDKVGDLDPRAKPAYCFQISDKALAVAGGVLETLLSRPEIRQAFGS